MPLEYTTFFLMEAIAAKKQQKYIFFNVECTQRLIFLGDRATFDTLSHVQVVSFAINYKFKFCRT